MEMVGVNEENLCMIYRSPKIKLQKQARQKTSVTEVTEAGQSK